MRSLLLLALLSALAPAADPLAVVQAAIAQMDGGEALPADFQHAPGETLFFSCRIAGFTKSPKEEIHLKYSVQAFDPKGVPLSEIYTNETEEEVGPQDKEWLPKIETQLDLPPMLRGGAYKVLVKVEDVLAKTSAELAVPFQVHAKDVAASATLTVRNFQWYHNEDEEKPMARPVYHPGDSMWMKFDMVGYKYGEGNKIDVSYVASLVLASGKVIYTQPEPAVEQSEAFYPKPYIEGEFGISLQKNFQPGAYTMAVAVKDAIGKTSYEGKFTFTVQ
jgi:hypothetical protein